jgi:hypothetical protein
VRARGLALLILVLGTGAVLVPSASAEIVPNPNPSLIAEWHPCEPGTGVTVIVDRHALADHMVYVRCALGAQPSGLAALEDAGFALEGTLAWGLAFICRIDGQPTLAEEDCVRTPGGSRYWSYWHGRPGGQWGYSGVGASNPLSSAGTGIDGVQGWGFALKPRIEPMNGAGPSSFTLPPAGGSSVIPAGLASDWLERVTVKTAEMALEPGSGVNPSSTEEMLDLAIALGEAGGGSQELSPIANFLDGRQAGPDFEYSALERWANPRGDGLDPESPDFPLYGYARSYAKAILAIEALGEDPTDFAGVDFRAELLAKIDEATGRLRDKSAGGIETFGEAPGELGPTVHALAGSGGLPAKALKSLDLLVAGQNGDGSFGEGLGPTVRAIEAMAAAREVGHGDAALDAALDKAGDFLESLQEPDGGIRQDAKAEPKYDPSLASTAEGALGLGLAGHSEAAERAAKWVSRYQVTAEYAGTPDPVTNEPAPAEDLIGAFGEDKDTLKEMLAYGLPHGVVPYGVYYGARQPTAEALRALLAAGPYGPFYAELDQGALHFASQTVGSQSGAQAATLTNRDVRPVTIEAASLEGPQAGDFALDGGDCVGKTLDPGGSCELSARFSPSAEGIRDAVARLELAGAEQAVELALSGTAVPLITHTVAVSTSGSGAIGTQTGAIQGCATIPPAGTCSGPYEEGSTVTLTAAPAPHHKLTGWSVTGAAATTCAGATSPCTVTIGTTDVAIVATFAPITRTLAVATVGLGRVSANVGAIKQCATEPANGTCSGAYADGAVVVLTATPGLNQDFKGWSVPGEPSACLGTSPCTVSIDADKTVTAAFAPSAFSPDDPLTPAGKTGPGGASPVAPLAAPGAVGRDRVVTVATVSCPVGATSCAVKTPKQVRVKIDGRRYAARVLLPQALAGGESAPLRIRLPRRAAKMLEGHGATVRVRVWFFADGAAPLVQLVEARIEAEG